MVLEGDDAHTLRLGPGRVSATGGPGEGGNMVIAAHRDTFFRSLHNIRKDDVIRFHDQGRVLSL
jgi:sortase A